METSVEGLDLQLTYLTHDARRIMNELGLQGLNLYWQVKLMECLYNYNSLTVSEIIRDKARKLPGHPGYNILREAMKFLGTRKQYNHVVFTQRAMRNLYRLDRIILLADYTVKMDVLATTLDKLDDDDLGEILSTVNKCGMGLLLIKIEEYIGGRERQRRELERNEDVKPVRKASPSETGKQLLRQTIEDMDMCKREL